VEEELFVVDPAALTPVACSEALFRHRRFARGAVSPRDV
jgi:hypothetical protein